MQFSTSSKLLEREMTGSSSISISSIKEINYSRGKDFLKKVVSTGGMQRIPALKISRPYHCVPTSTAVEIRLLFACIS